MKRYSFLPVIVVTGLAILVAGCGKKDDKTEKTGKTEKTKDDDNGHGGHSSKKSAKERLVGTWESNIELDDAKIEAMLKAQKTPPEKMKEAKETVSKMFGNMKVAIEMKADGTSVITSSGVGPKPQVKKGTWKIIEEDGDTVKLETKEEGKDEADTITLVFKSDDELTYSTDDPDFAKAPFKTPVAFIRKTE